MQLFPGQISYIAVLLIALIDAVWISLAPVSLPLHQLAEPAINMVVLAALVFVIGRISFPEPRYEAVAHKLGYLFQGMLFLQISWIAIRLLNHVSMTTAYPYADDLLIAWDRYVPISWEWYFGLVQENRFLRITLDVFYTSLTPLSFVSFLILYFYAGLERTRYFLETFLVTAIICTAAGMFFPAKAAVAMAFGDVTSIAGFNSVPGVYHLDHMAQLRSGLPAVLDLDDLPGLVTFPSFHTAAGILLMGAFWRTGLFPFMAAYSVVMIAGTPVFGGHYFIDLIAGTAVALAVLYVFARLPRYAGLFGNSAETPPRAARKPRHSSATG